MTLYKVRQNYKHCSGTVETISKKRPNAAGKRKGTCNYDGLTFTATKTCLHNFFRRDEIPTFKEVAPALRDHAMLSSYSEFTLYRVLRNFGFEKRERDRNSFFVERENVHERTSTSGYGVT